VTTLNNAYFDFWINWACHLQRLHLKHLVWSQDEQLAERVDKYVQSGGLPQRTLVTSFFSLHMAQAFPSGNQSSIFRGKAFNRICNFRVLSIKLLMTHGFSVLASDVDVVFIGDAWRFFRGPEECNYEYQQNDKNGREGETVEGNGGFTLWWASATSLSFLERVLIQSELWPHRDDQAALWETIRNTKHRRPHVLKYCPLPYNTFPAGKQLHASYLSVDSAAIHANWLDGKLAKRSTLETLGLWKVIVSDHFEGEYKLTCAVNASTAEVAPLDQFWLWASRHHSLINKHHDHLRA